MTQEDKELLIKDLCARLPYGVKFCFANSNTYTIKGIDLIVTDEGNWEYAVTAKGIDPIEIKYVKPYLRPMSSMTEEEAKEMFGVLYPYRNVTVEIEQDKVRYGYIENDNFCHEVFHFNDIYSLEQLDWLNSHHFDYRGLIEKGLALEAPEDMYDF